MTSVSSCPCDRAAVSTTSTVAMAIEWDTEPVVGRVATSARSADARCSAAAEAEAEPGVVASTAK